MFFLKKGAVQIKCNIIIITFIIIIIILRLLCISTHTHTNEQEDEDGDGHHERSVSIESDGLDDPRFEDLVPPAESNTQSHDNTAENIHTHTQNNKVHTRDSTTVQQYSTDT